MKYSNIRKARFLSRPNRFIAQVELDGCVETVHVKNTGRCRELLVPGCTVYLEGPFLEGRKTKYDLIAVEKETDGGAILINMDSQVVNGCVEEWLPVSGLFPLGAGIKREVKWGASRFDFCISGETFLEVKGVTLENGGVAMFPDAPTERGAKHVRELEKLAREGRDAYIVFVVQMKGVQLMTPNEKTDPEFAAALRSAAEAGVKVLCYDCIVTPDSIKIDKEVKLSLGLG